MALNSRCDKKESTLLLDDSNNSKCSHSFGTDTFIVNENQEQSISDHKINRTFGKVLLAYILLMCSVLCLCASIASVEVLSGSVPEFELNSWRFGAQVIVVLPFANMRLLSSKQ